MIQVVRVIYKVTLAVCYCNTMFIFRMLAVKLIQCPFYLLMNVNIIILRGACVGSSLLLHGYKYAQRQTHRMCCVCI